MPGHLDTVYDAFLQIHISLQLLVKVMTSVPVHCHGKATTSWSNIICHFL